MLRWCREHRAVLLAVWLLAVFDPSFYADDWDGDGYDDDTGEWIDDTGGFDNGEDTSGFDDTTDTSGDIIDVPADSDSDGLTDEEETNGFEIFVTYTNWVYDDSSGES
jgi:hypothetical protein